MTDHEYLVFEGPFRERAGPILRSLADKLSEAGYGPMKVVDIDRDVCRGMGLEFADGGAQTFVDLILVDLETEGIEGVGLRLECSTWLSGVVWAPGNYTEDVSISTIGRLNERLNELESLLGDVCSRICQEWDRVMDTSHSQDAVNQVPI